VVGRKVQHYQFLDKLGAGGMGEIYRAQDTRLNRHVAIKVLIGSSASDPDRRRRFIQEAQAASALNHPNIVTLHDILTDDGSQYMVLEHIQGKTLADLIPRGGLRVPQVLKLAMQMTDALQTAHAAGIIHRDLKPGNVMVTDSGLVKILDFGLAKLSEPAPVTQDADATRTIADAPLTIEGSIIGTVSYMSPEQAEGRKVDTRSDIFSLGVVLYEMITGNRAFQADTAVGTLSMILRDSPKPIAEIAPDVPPRLAHVVDRCLAKSPDDRLQTMKDVHMALGGLKHESDSGILYRSMMVGSAEMPASPASKPPSATSASSASVTAAPVSTTEAPKSSNVKWIVGGAVAIAMIGAGGYVATQPIPPEAGFVLEQMAKVASAPAASEEVLNNDAIVQMIAANVPLEVIYSQIRNSPNKFNFSASEVIRLTGSKVPPAVIEAMRNPKSIPASITATGPKATPKGPEPTKTDPATASSTPAAPAATTTPPPPSPAPAATREVVVSDGTPFVIALDADVPEDSKPGAQLKFSVLSDLKIGDSVAIRKGSPASGEIVQGKRTFGKMTLRLLTVNAADGKTYKVRALAANGNKNNERPVETQVKPKKDKVVSEAGTQYIAYVDGDMHVIVPGRK
jgi:serine/threonine-protein kinase